MGGPGVSAEWWQASKQSPCPVHGTNSLKTCISGRPLLPVCTVSKRRGHELALAMSFKGACKFKKNLGKSDPMDASTISGCVGLACAVNTILQGYIKFVTKSHFGGPPPSSGLLPTPQIQGEKLGRQSCKITYGYPFWILLGYQAIGNFTILDNFNPLNCELATISCSPTKLVLLLAIAV